MESDELVPEGLFSFGSVLTLSGRYVTPALPHVIPRYPTYPLFSFVPSSRSHTSDNPNNPNNPITLITLKPKSILGSVWSRWTTLIGALAGPGAHRRCVRRTQGGRKPLCTLTPHRRSPPFRRSQIQIFNSSQPTPPWCSCCSRSRCTNNRPSNSSPTSSRLLVVLLFSSLRSELLQRHRCQLSRFLRLRTLVHPRLRHRCCRGLIQSSHNPLLPPMHRL